MFVVNVRNAEDALKAMKLKRNEFVHVGGVGVLPYVLLKKTFTVLRQTRVREALVSKDEGFMRIGYGTGQVRLRVHTGEDHHDNFNPEQF